jgi:hypothetical protein
LVNRAARGRAGTASRLIAYVVWGDDFLDGVEVARVVEEFLHLPAHHGFVLFSGHTYILLSDPLQLRGS